MKQNGVLFHLFFLSKILATNPRSIRHKGNYGSSVVYLIKEILYILFPLEDRWGIAPLVTFYFIFLKQVYQLYHFTYQFILLPFFLLSTLLSNFKSVITPTLCKFHFIASVSDSQTTQPPLLLSLFLIKIVICIWQMTNISAYLNNFTLKYSLHNVPKTRCFAFQLLSVKLSVEGKGHHVPERGVWLMCTFLALLYLYIHHWEGFADKGLLLLGFSMNYPFHGMQKFCGNWSYWPHPLTHISKINLPLISWVRIISFETNLEQIFWNVCDALVRCYNHILLSCMKSCMKRTKDWR